MRAGNTLVDSAMTSSWLFHLCLEFTGARMIIAAWRADALLIIDLSLRCDAVLASFVVPSAAGRDNGSTLACPGWRHYPFRAGIVRLASE